MTQNLCFITVDGTCWGLAAGDILVASVIDPCDGYSSTDGYAGWNSARTFLIMEVVPVTDVTSKPSLQDENIHRIQFCDLAQIDQIHGVKY